MRIAILTCLVSVCWGVLASGETISGKYVEARNAAMWAGPCLYNSEMGVVGDKATLAWKVDEGQFENVALDGLAIVAVVFGDRTFGMGSEVKTQTIFVVDERASEAQQSALIGLAKSLATETIQEVIEVKRKKIDIEIANNDSASSFVDAGIARIRTRRLRRTDNLCGTDTRRMVYPALAKITDERAAYTLENLYEANEAGITAKRLEDRNAPTSVVGKFSL